MNGLLVRELPFEHPVEVDLVWHRRDEADSGHRWFREMLRETETAG